ncbi:MAG: O-antigen ligase family protein [Chloroflexi bacterium]|nr:O-antigen ligase family protein [Chloroflexota bacterium]
MATSLLGIYSKMPFVSLGTQGAIALLAIIWLYRPAVGGWPTTYPRGPVPAAPFVAGTAAAYLLWAIISSFPSTDVAVSLSFGGQWASYFLVFLLAAGILAPRSCQTQWRLAAQIIILLGLVMSMAAIYLYWGEMGQEAQPVMNSLLGNKNHFAGYLGLILPLSLALYLSAPSFREALAYGGSSVLLASCLFLTYSRGGWFAMAPSLVITILFLLTRQNWQRLLSLLAILLIFTAGAAYLIQGSSLGYAVGTGSRAITSVASAATGGEATGTLGPRLNYWEGALNIMKDNPLWGTGPGTFPTIFSEYQKDPRFFSKYAHNFPLQSGAEMGLLGLLLALAFMAALAWRGWSAWQDRRNTTPLMAGLIGGTLASSLHNLVELDWYIPALGLLFWIEVGMLAATPPPLSKPPTREIRPILMGMAAILLLWASLQIGEQFLLERGEYAWAARLNPLDPQPYFLAANRALDKFVESKRVENLEAGISAASKATQLSPRNVSYRGLLARLYLEEAALGMPTLEPAVREMEAISSKNPAFQDPQTYRRLGRAYLDLRQWEKAQKTYQALLDAYPQGVDSPQPQFGGLSRDELAEVLAETHLALGNLSFDRGAAKEAREHYQQAILLQPQNLPAHFNLGAVYFQEGSLELTLKEFLAARELSPRLAPTYLRLGQVYHALGQETEARQSLEAALSIDPGYLEARHFLESLK